MESHYSFSPTSLICLTGVTLISCLLENGSTWSRQISRNFWSAIQVTSTKDREVYFLSWSIFGGFLVKICWQSQPGKRISSPGARYFGAGSSTLGSKPPVMVLGQQGWNPPARRKLFKPVLLHLLVVFQEGQLGAFASCWAMMHFVAPRCRPKP